MSRPTIVLTYPIHKKLIKELLSPKAKVIIATTLRSQIQALAEADALITLVTHPVNEALLRHAPRLKVVGNMAVGIDNIDLKACARRGIKVVNTPNVLTRSTAETAVALLFAAARRFAEGYLLCHRGEPWKWAPDMLLGLELKGRHAVIVGPGRIGSETARLFRALGLSAEFISRRDSVSGIRRKLARAQVLSIHTPLTPITRHWLNSERLELLPRDAIVINTSRGPVIDERALIRALKNHRIFAAGLDVYEQEPHIPLALRKLKNAVLLPHLGSATETARADMARLVMTGVLAILSGKRPSNQVRF